MLLQIYAAVLFQKFRILASDMLLVSFQANMMVCCFKLQVVHFFQFYFLQPHALQIKNIHIHEFMIQKNSFDPRLNYHMAEQSQHTVVGQCDQAIVWDAMSNGL